jgi:hypothetical protein
VAAARSGSHSYRVGDAAHTDGTANRFVPVPLECVECHAVSDASAWRWRGYRTDDPTEHEEPALAFYCPSCAEREFGNLHHESGQDGYPLY